MPHRRTSSQFLFLNGSVHSYYSMPVVIVLLLFHANTIIRARDHRFLQFPFNEALNSGDVSNTMFGNEKRGGARVGFSGRIILT